MKRVFLKKHDPETPQCKFDFQFGQSNFEHKNTKEQCQNWCTAPQRPKMRAQGIMVQVESSAFVAARCNVARGALH